MYVRDVYVLKTMASADFGFEHKPFETKIDEMQPSVVFIRPWQLHRRVSRHSHVQGFACLS